MNLILHFALPIVTIISLFAIANINRSFYMEKIQPETGLLEILHIIIPAISFFLCLYLLRNKNLRKDKYLFATIMAFLVANLYISGEEASWGQHFFGWEVAGNWQEINDQQETNIHNISSWFDQKPRLLLELFVIFFGIIIPVASCFSQKVKSHNFNRFFPSLYFLPTSLLAEFSRLIERLSLDGLSVFPSGIRYSEIQELYFYYFMMLYICFLGSCLKSRNS